MPLPFGNPSCSRNLEVCKIKEVYAPSFTIRTMFQTMSFDLVTGIEHTFLRPCRSTFYQQSLPCCSHNRTVTESWLLELLQGSYHKQKYHWCEKNVIILMPWLLSGTKKCQDPDRIWTVWTMTSHVQTPRKHSIHSVLGGLEVWILYFYLSYRFWSYS